MKKQNIHIILGTAHLGTTPGKSSPDGRLKEAVYSRERLAVIKAVLESQGYQVAYDYEPLAPKNKWTTIRRKAGWKAEQAKELSYRAQHVNSCCSQYGADNCIYVSLHVNAAGSDNKWHGAGGWCAYTSIGKTKADQLAECFYDAAIYNLKDYISLMAAGKLKGDYTEEQTPLRMNYTDGDRDLEANFFVLNHTRCPAILTENLFQDNLSDVNFLLSETGKHVIERLHIEGILSYIENYMLR